MKLSVPYFRQQTDYSCGAASLHMIDAFFHTQIREKKLRQKLHTSKKFGTSHTELIREARAGLLLLSERKRFNAQSPFSCCGRHTGHR